MAERRSIREQRIAALRRAQAIRAARAAVLAELRRGATTVAAVLEHPDLATANIETVLRNTPDRHRNAPTLRRQAPRLRHGDRVALDVASCGPYRAIYQLTERQKRVISAHYPGGNDAD